MSSTASVPAHLFGPDREEILDMESWLAHAPPDKGRAQWKDGHSAKEQAKAWLRDGSGEDSHDPPLGEVEVLPAEAVEEVRAALRDYGFTDVSPRAGGFVASRPRSG